MTIVEVAKGCLVGKKYRCPDLQLELSIRLSKDFDDKTTLSLFWSDGKQSWGFPRSVADLIREDYEEIL